MKTKLNLTIEHDILIRMKEYASRQKMSISEIVEDYFKAVSSPKNQDSFVEMIDRLPKPNLDHTLDLSEEYYREQARKYGL